MSSQEPASSTAAEQIDAVMHIDIQPDYRVPGEARLLDLVRWARTRPDFEVIELLQEHKIANHYMLVCRFPTRGAYVAFVESDTVRATRDVLAPWLGSPWDERLATRIDRDA